jgi:hypothetical protein
MTQQQILSDIDDSRDPKEEDEQMQLLYQEIFQNECDKLGLTHEEMHKLYIGKVEK